MMFTISKHAELPASRLCSLCAHFLIIGTVTQMSNLLSAFPRHNTEKLTVNTKLRCTKVTVGEKKNNAGSVCGGVVKFPNVAAVLTLKMTYKDYLKKVPRLQLFSSNKSKM